MMMVISRHDGLWPRCKVDETTLPHSLNRLRKRVPSEDATHAFAARTDCLSSLFTVPLCSYMYWRRCRVL